ncbi:MAG: integrase core domain-containing protein [Limisphaerales bacterium]
MAIYPQAAFESQCLGTQAFPLFAQRFGHRAVQPSLSINITYIRQWGGFVYLTALIDWFNRYVLARELSITFEADFCVVVVERAMAAQRPGSAIRQSALPSTPVGGPTALKHGWARAGLRERLQERLRHTVKYEEVYLKDYRNVPEARHGLDLYFSFYNDQHIHHALDYRTPPKSVESAITEEKARAAPQTPQPPESSKLLRNVPKDAEEGGV